MPTSRTGLKVRVRAIRPEALKNALAVKPYVLLLRAASRRLPHLRQRLAQAPARPAYPIQWTSERQRRYVMALLRANDNLPYRRTERLERGWQSVIRPEAFGASITTFNAMPYAKFVQGGLNVPVGSSAFPPQQRFHRISGWRPAQPIIVEAMTTIRDDVVEQYARQLERQTIGFNVRIRTE
jgi:hypothetical protein